MTEPTKDPAPKNILWLDCETEGLEAQKHNILEVAWKFCPDGPLGAATTQGEAVLPILTNPTTWDPFVLEMHSKNGLILACTKARNALKDYQINQALEKLEERIIRSLPIAHNRKFTLAGNTVHFDLGFLKVYMPNLAKHLSHRCFDVSAIAMAAYDDGMPYEKAEPAHRAMPDVDSSIAYYRRIKAWRAKQHDECVKFVSRAGQILDGSNPFLGT